MNPSRVYFSEADAGRMIDVWAATQLLSLDDVARRHAREIESASAIIRQLLERETLRFDAAPKLSPPVPSLVELMA